MLRKQRIVLDPWIIELNNLIKQFQKFERITKSNIIFNPPN